MYEGGTVARLKLVLALFLPALFIALPVAGSAGPLGLAGALTAGVATALVVCVVLTIRLEATATPVQQHAVSLRERARLANFLRLRDPDARGRTRPRAPSPSHAAA